MAASVTLTGIPQYGFFPQTDGTGNINGRKPHDIPPNHTFSPCRLALLSGQVMAAEAPPSTDGHTGGVFTPEQEARIGQVAADYLLAHPDILIQVSQKLQAQQQDRQIKAMTAAVLANQDALVNDKDNPSYGPADAKVVLVELFDYQCVVCSQEALSWKR